MQCCIALNIGFYIQPFDYIVHKPNRSVLSGFQLQEIGKTRDERDEERERKENRGTKKSREAVPKGPI